MDFGVEYSTNPHIEMFGHEELFNSHEEAAARADELTRHFRAVWISEKGKRVDSGRPD